MPSHSGAKPDDSGKRKPDQLLHARPFQVLLDSLPAAAYTCDPDGLITYFNQHSVQLWGRTPKLNDPEDRFCGSFKLFLADGKPIKHEECWMARALKTGEDFNGQEIIIQRPDGSRLTALAHANPLRDEQGQLLGAVNVLIDISDRKRAEEVQARLYAELREADRRKDEFLATLAHELRNPLAPISNSLQLLKLADDLNPTVQKVRDVMERQVNHMVRLVDDLMEVSRITRGKIDLRTAPIELAAVVSSAVETSRPLIEAAGHQLAIKLPSDPIMLEADAVRLSQVISNLLNNAAKYTPQGGQIWLTARLEVRDAVISVRDNGVGISAEMLPRVFDMFAQIDQTVSRSQGGLGIGLTLAKKLVLMHGGQIEAHSAGSDTGSEFIIRLPVISAPRPIQKPPAPAARKTLPTRRILVVDDTHAAAYMLGKLLETMGQQVQTVNSAAAALESARQNPPDVVISDIAMPEMDGYELARRLRQEPRLKNAVLVALTGYGQDSDKQRASDAGFDRHLVKPVGLDTLQQLLGALAQPVGVTTRH
jgi:PAS domain S-box-containing protein